MTETTLHWPRMSPRPGQCRQCQRRRPVFTAGRRGAGSYNRGSRQYRSSVCGECAIEMLVSASTHAGAHSRSWSVSSLVRIVASLGTVEAAEAFDRYRQRVANSKVVVELWREEMTGGVFGR